MIFRWHPTRPKDAADRAGIDHVVLAFAMANATASFQSKVPVTTIRSEFPHAKVMIAVGGWGDDIGFFQASKTDASIKQFAADIATMLTNTGADGVGNYSAYSKPLDSMLITARHRLGVPWRQRR
jgi:chitinase